MAPQDWGAKNARFLPHDSPIPQERSIRDFRVWDTEGLQGGFLSYRQARGYVREVSTSLYSIPLDIIRLKS